MSVARVARFIRPKGIAAVSSLQRRFSSSDLGSADYPTEGFSGPFWRNTALFTVLFIGVANFTPTLLSSSNSATADERPWLTRVLSYYAPSKELWIKLNEKHLSQTEEAASNNLLVQGARRPIVRRFRYPLSFEQVSTHSLPVGGDVDLSDLVVKGDKD